jgi:hypothetical protein
LRRQYPDDPDPQVRAARLTSRATIIGAIIVSVGTVGVALMNKDDSKESPGSAPASPSSAPPKTVPTFKREIGDGEQAAPIVHFLYGRTKQWVWLETGFEPKNATNEWPETLQADSLLSPSSGSKARLNVLVPCTPANRKKVCGLVGIAFLPKPQDVSQDDFNIGYWIGDWVQIRGCFLVTGEFYDEAPTESEIDLKPQNVERCSS